MKRCCTCKVELNVNLFSKNKSEKDGLNRRCKTCQKKYYLRNKKRIIARVLVTTDRQKKRAYDKARRQTHKESILAYERIRNALPHRVKRAAEWVANHPEARRITSAKYAHKRRALIRKAIPKWYGELDQFILREALTLCKLREKATNMPWEVDHSIPLMGKTVCGLHCWNNFEVVPKSYNRRKRNNFPYPEWRRVTSAPPET